MLTEFDCGSRLFTYSGITRVSPGNVYLKKKMWDSVRQLITVVDVQNFSRWPWSGGQVYADGRPYSLSGANGCFRNL